MPERKRKRTVITGLGAVTPIGLDAESTYQAALQGRSGIVKLNDKDVPGLDVVRIGGQIIGFDPGKFLLSKEQRTYHEFALFSADAAVQAGIDAKVLETFTQSRGNRNDLIGCKLVGFDPDDVGVEIGSAVGGATYSAEIEDRILKVTPGSISAFSIDHINAYNAASLVHILTGVRGPGSTHATVCSSALMAIEAATMRIEVDQAKAMFAGATDSTVDRIGIRSFEAMRALSTNNDEPTKASKPFDEDGEGFAMSKGAAVLFLETVESAQNRFPKGQLPIYAEIVGYANNSYPDNGPRPDQAGEVKAMRRAIAMAGITPDMINLVNAHAAGTPAGDPPELAALLEVFGNRSDLMINATKSLIGHTMGPAGGIGALLTAFDLRNQTVHPMINLEKPRKVKVGEDFIEPKFDFVTGSAREKTPVEYAMINAFGLGGKNAILILKR